MSNAINEWPSTSKGYKVMNSLGCGYFGMVWRGEVLEGKHKGEQVAIKMIELDKCADNKIDDIRKSMLLANLLAHPNILSYKIAFISKQELWLVSEIMEYGSISKIIQTFFPNGIKDQAFIATVLKEALKGLTYLHQNNQIHRDLKGASILVGQDGSVKISDFGVATAIKAGEKKNTIIGSPCWMAPEVLDQDDKSGYDAKADIWSLGITALEMAHGHPPNSDLCTMKLILKTLNEEPPLLSDETCWDDHFREFIASCLVKDPSKRKGADELLKANRVFFSKAKGQEYIRDKLRAVSKGVTNNEVHAVTPNSFLSSSKKCTIQFDFRMAGEEEEGTDNWNDKKDLQMNVEHNHLTKEESDYMLLQTLQNCLVSNGYKNSFKSSKSSELKSDMKQTCLAAHRMIHKEKSEKLMLSKGDDFPFLNEEEN